MPTLRIARFALRDDVDEQGLRASRRHLLDYVQENFPGLKWTQLARLDDGRWQDTWTWESAAHMEAAVDAVPEFPDAVRAQLELLGDAEAAVAEVIEWAGEGDN